LNLNAEANAKAQGPSAVQPQSKERDLQVASPSAVGQVLEYRRRSDTFTLKRHECRAPSKILANVIDSDVLHCEDAEKKNFRRAAKI
jgi:hypothetical protein